MTDIPEEIRVREHSCLKGIFIISENGKTTPYRLKSTVDAEREADSKTIHGLKCDLEMSNEAIRLSREHLKKIGIHAAFFDDCAALAAKKILDQQETIRELAAALMFYAEDDMVVGKTVNGKIEGILDGTRLAQQTLADNAPRIAEAQK